MIFEDVVQSHVKFKHVSLMVFVLSSMAGTSTKHRFENRTFAYVVMVVRNASLLIFEMNV